ncbi:MAG: hypothetical protein COV29_00965 [Candidatus Yanofskybacteria bacterium CG10_big_fil_rev_8_21_14_0_10_36_16]|uniref:Metallo-beta-lactamase domain-containing protein n=1 Tax=Candidatus Yanofskybacteria bacterium CG10_big_fil_rev_8_21_14_0_10_36_16 TaxID=1975096 RepID=A0A2J0Q828_9BACT|nr:MAG: hypothetical protein COV29_00965 [Candidatus Yanofskybacteria bacterium CG10_big_fil_rev_8_21_14_0_10_36_16]
MPQKIHNMYIWILVITAILTVFSFYAISKLPDGKTHVWFLDVGQGDAIFIQTPKGNQILVDGGPGSSVIQELGAVMPFWDHTIDLVVMTHPDADHINGLLDVLGRYHVAQSIETGIGCETDQCQFWEKLIKQEDAIRHYVSLGYKIESSDGVSFDILHPFENQNNQSVSKKNNSSVVSKMVYGENELLLTGDIEKQVENKLALSGIDIKSDLLKVAHHGSKTSTTEQFVKTIKPQLAFISVGAENRYGHPTEQTLNTLENLGVKYYRTDIDGRVELVLSEDNYMIKKTGK